MVREFTVTTDASNYEIGKKLSQKDKKGNEKIANVCSKTIDKSQRNYVAID